MNTVHNDIQWNNAHELKPRVPRQQKESWTDRYTDSGRDPRQPDLQVTQKQGFSLTPQSCQAGLISVNMGSHDNHYENPTQILSKTTYKIF